MPNLISQILDWLARPFDVAFSHRHGNFGDMTRNQATSFPQQLLNVLRELQIRTLDPQQWERRLASRLLDRFEFTEEFHRPMLVALGRAFPQLQFLICKAAGSLFAVSPKDDTIGFSLIQGKAFEREVFDRALERLEHHEPRIAFKGRAFVDIGANVGYMTVYASQSGHFNRALCAEPDPVNFRLLKATIAMNDLEAFARLLPTAIGHKNGEVPLELADQNLGDHRVRVNADSSDGVYQEARRTTIRVPVTTLDALLSNENLQPADVGLVWIDTQGYDGFVLAGATDLQRGSVPVVCEFWPYGMRRSEGWPIFRDTVRSSFTGYYDLSESTAIFHPTDAINALFDKLGAGIGHTDLLLLPR
jgi:FkbM family methyltransferase